MTVLALGKMEVVGIDGDGAWWGIEAASY